MACMLAAILKPISMSAFKDRLNQSGHGKFIGEDVKTLFHKIARAGFGTFTSGHPLEVSGDFYGGISEIASEEGSNLSWLRAIEEIGFTSYDINARRMVRKAHAAYWDKNQKTLTEALSPESGIFHSVRIRSDDLSFVAYPFSCERFRILPESFQTKLLPKVREVLSWHLAYMPEWVRYLENVEIKHRVALGEALLLQGDLARASVVASELKACKPKTRRCEGWCLAGVVACFQGKREESIEALTQGLALRGSRKVHTALDALLTVSLAMLDDPTLNEHLMSLEPGKRKGHSALLLDEIHRTLKGVTEVGSYDLARAEQQSSLARLIIAHTWSWRGLPMADEWEEMVIQVTENARGHHLWLPVAVGTAFLSSADTDIDSGKFPDVVPWTSERKPLAPWERNLIALEQFASKAGHRSPSVTSSKPTEERLIWTLEVSAHGEQIVEVVPHLQKSKGRAWTAGRRVALKRLVRESPPWITEADAPVIACIEQGGWPHEHYFLDPNRALYQLCGHPLVFRSGNVTQPIEVMQHALKFILREGADGAVAAELQPARDFRIHHSSGYESWWETPNRLAVMKVSDEEIQVVRLLGLSNGEQTIPAEGKERLVAALESLKGKLQVFTDVDAVGDGESKVIALEPQLTPQVHLSPLVDGLKVALLVQPLQDCDFFFAPGIGSHTVFGEVEGEARKTERALSEEVARASEFLRECPTLSNQEQEQLYEWRLPDPETCLELLSEIQPLRDRVEICWPQGERFKLAAEVTAQRLKFKVTSRKDWFELTGELRIDEDQVIQLQALLEMLANEESLGRFVKLADGQFIALTREFRTRLRDLEAFTTEGKGGARRLNPLAAHAVTELVEESEATMSKKWVDHLERLRGAETHKAKVPSTLKAELRPYQREGFEWLTRQAHWGVGACLADDMGLGKTIQTLALLLDRAPSGPALVVAPTSVTRNWLEEAHRFAPTLKVTLFGPGDREASLQGLEPFDLVLCTYGLLPLEIDRLEKVSWSTIVLDEAQAIKNADTQRWKAATKLQADFKVITTGTPIENHLGELHALFQFINPGLLGSRQRFHVKFTDPIAKERDEGARARLKRLIRPFILRRLKHEVLDDLPSRTDIILRVEPTEKEQAFYEALRRQVVKRLEEGSDDESAGEQSLRILAEIMKLRRACCDPKLVDPKLTLESSKRRLFAETLDELLANGHKALVFSQFVDHLSLLREHLDEAGISYQYLDGQTPAKKRHERVRAFQAGEGDVFLISLRAGGTGLNLTAADYVIHMDPWWNPAVEDQASDRAHRIGQQRPVTVYRLVMAQTIEEKIVDLHHEKRDLADSLLSGAETVGKLSPDQLLALLRDDR